MKKKLFLFLGLIEQPILSTISSKHKGYPFGSFVTYVSGWDRTVFLYLSDLADHTKKFEKRSQVVYHNFKKMKTGIYKIVRD